MQNSYQLMFTPIAEDDSDRIYRYISEHLVAPKGAYDLMEEIEASIMRLRDFPYSGSPAYCLICSMGRGEWVYSLFIVNSIDLADVFLLKKNVHVKIYNDTGDPEERSE